MPATGQIIGAAAAFVWLGMVLAISFQETPLKFRAPASPCPSDSASAGSFSAP